MESCDLAQPLYRVMFRDVGCCIGVVVVRGIENDCKNFHTFSLVGTTPKLA